MIFPRKVRLLCCSHGILLLLHPAAGLGAQETDFEPGCTDPVHTGVVKGQVINDSTGLPAPRHGVVLQGSEMCFALPDSTAVFEVRNVPPGEYELSVGDLTIRNFAPIPITVAADTVHVEVRVQPYNIVADCERMADCVGFLVPSPAAEMPPDQAVLLETGFRTAIAVALAKGGVQADWVPCVRDATPSVLAALRQRIPGVVASSECDMLPVADGVLDKRMQHLPSGRPAYEISFKLMQVSDDAASGLVQLSVAPLWGSGWFCRYGRDSEGWQLLGCELKIQA